MHYAGRPSFCSELQVSHPSCPVRQVGAGTGYWASLLNASGVDVVAYDSAPVDSAQRNGHHVVSTGTAPGQGMTNAPPFFSVAHADAADAAAAHPGRALLLCWPPPEVATGVADAPQEARRSAEPPRCLPSALQPARRQASILSPGTHHLSSMLGLALLLRAGAGDGSLRSERFRR